MPAHSTLKFPLEFPVKIMGRDTPEFHAAVTEIIGRHVAPLDTLMVRRQASAEGRFISITVTFDAQSREQLDRLYEALTSHDQILMVL